jgi:hypothetical protein
MRYQVGLELLDSRDPHTSAFQAGWITGMYYCTQLLTFFFFSPMLGSNLGECSTTELHP